MTRRTDTWTTCQHRIPTCCAGTSQPGGLEPAPPGRRLFTGRARHLPVTASNCAKLRVYRQPNLGHSLRWAIRGWLCRSARVRDGPDLFSIFTNLKLCLANATHNFKWVKIVCPRLVSCVQHAPRSLQEEEKRRPATFSTPRKACRNWRETATALLRSVLSAKPGG